MVSQVNAREKFDHQINPGFIIGLERLREGLEWFYGCNNFTVFGDIMQLTVRVYILQPENLVESLQQERFIRQEPLEVIPKAVLDSIRANGWYQIQPFDRRLFN
ncbi:hypothetical protein FHETE_2443 [Fusarium heterosporum]|uniref:Uncharacterized protein n=1 Tax=Fusarium heterosporum TaxID=42747 RepID=A0A8H5TUP3_FUSHE|nr:hypothetical protein FHETE_2443 [Fusarium heterosporum]